jgi:sorbitol-specific phosphotransferase system component IIA
MIPTSVTEIGAYAFFGCTGLTTVTIPNSVTSIGNGAFSQCTGLKHVTALPTTPPTIAENTFYNCSAHLLATSEDYKTADYWKNFKNIKIDANVSDEIGGGDVVSRELIDGIYYDIDGFDATVVGCLNSVTNLNIPSEITYNGHTYPVMSIGDKAFYKCTGLTSVTIPNSVTTIENGAFYSCTGLTKVNISDIAAWCGIALEDYFSNPLGYAQHLYLNDQEITELTIPNSVTSIGAYAFFNCIGLTSVTIPNSVTSIDVNAFEYCAGLTSVSIPNSVTSIGQHSFAYCTGLTAVNIGNLVSSIGNGAFASCTSLQRFVVESDNAYFASDSVGVLYNKDFTTLVSCPGGKTEFNIPESVTSIGNDAFRGCEALTSITIPNSVTTIGSEAFNFCTKLTSVTIPNSVTSIGNLAFNGCRGLKKIIALPTTPPTVEEQTFYNYSVPLIAVSEAYKTAAYWKNFTNITIDANAGDENAGGDVVSNELIDDNYYDIDGFEASVVGCVDSVTSLNIPSEITYNGHTYPVTSIGAEAFKNCKGLTAVTIPNSVTSIGASAFFGCSSLTSVTIPNSVTTIGGSAFYYCSGLTSVTIGSAVTEIKYYAFGSCTSLQKFIVESGNTEFAADEQGALYNKDFTTLLICPAGKTSFDIPQTVTSIGGLAFWGCAGLISVTIPNSVTIIGSMAFNGCSGLTELVIPDSVTTIGYTAFAMCTGLTSVTIPSSVTSIDAFAFSGCSGLQRIIALPTTPPTIEEQTFDNYSVPLIAVSEAYKTADYWKNFTNITIDANAGDANAGGDVVSKVLIGDIYYDIDGSVATVVGRADSVTKLNIPSEVMYNWSTYPVTSLGAEAFKDCTDITAVTLPNSVTTIGDYAFYRCTGLTSITIPEAVTSIGAEAFSYCGLLSVSIPNSVTTIGDYAFSWCTGLTSITLPDSVTKLGMATFYGCTGLTAVSIGNSVSSIGHGAFAACTSLQRFVVESDNAYFATDSAGALYNKDFTTLVSCPGSKTEFTIPESVTSIAGAAFFGCKGLTSITIPGSVTSIEQETFYECTGLTSVIIPDAVISIGAYAFVGCTGLTSVTIGNAVTSIGEFSFYGCTGLTSVAIGNAVTSIGKAAFYNCKGLLSVDIPNSVTEIADWVFTHCTGLTTVYIGNSVTSIGDYTFWDCGGLKQIIALPTKPPTVGEKTFYNYSAPLIAVSEDYKTADYWQNFTNITIDANAGDENAGGDVVSKVLIDGIYYDIDGSVATVVGCADAVTELNIPGEIRYNRHKYSVTSIGAEAFKNCTGLTSVTIGNSVTTIGEDAFSSCTGLTLVTIGNSVTTIGNRAFAQCTSLQEFTVDSNNECFATDSAGALYNKDFTLLVACPAGKTYFDIPESVIVIGPYAFSGGSLTSVTIPDSVTAIGKGAFYSCEGLTTVTIPDSVTAIGASAFSSCKGLTTVTIGNSVIDIEFGAFWGCSSLTTVTIPNSVIVIDYYAFYGCSSLTSVTIGNSVIEIGGYAFSFCEGLTTVTIGNSVTTIGEGAFCGCEELTSVTIPDSVTTIGNNAFYGCSLTSVTCLWDVPLSASHNLFSNKTYETCSLYVPAGTRDAYASVVPWKYFNQITEMYLSDVSEISFDGNAPCSVENGAICVSGDVDVRILSLNGATIYSGCGENRINVVPGVYIVIVNNTATKVVVK